VIPPRSTTEHQWFMKSLHGVTTSVVFEISYETFTTYSCDHSTLPKPPDAARVQIIGSIEAYIVACDPVYALIYAQLRVFDEGALLCFVLSTSIEEPGKVRLG
jgi:hypothetical protein